MILAPPTHSSGKFGRLPTIFFHPPIFDTHFLQQPVTSPESERTERLGFEGEINRKKMVTFFQKHHELVFATAFICIGVAYMLFGRDAVTIEDLENLWPAVKNWSLKIGDQIKSLIADLTK